MLFQNELLEPANILKFANYLYLEEDYSAALQEYRRYIFLSDSLQTQVQEKIVDCLVRIKNFGEAIKESEKFEDTSKKNYTKGWIYFLAGNYDSARFFLENIGIPYKEQANRIIGLSHAYEFKFNLAKDFIQLPKPSPNYKSSVLGGVFAVFPGGGHFYCGRVSDGIYSLLVISTASLLSYYYYHRKENIKFGISLGAAILFYAGNIYGGINAVRNYNYYQNEKYLQKTIEANQSIR